MVPLAIITAVLLCFVKEKPLATEVGAEIMPESLAEGQLIVDEDLLGDAETPASEAAATPRAPR